MVSVIVFTLFDAATLAHFKKIVIVPSCASTPALNRSAWRRQDMLMLHVHCLVVATSAYVATFDMLIDHYVGTRDMNM